MRFGPYSATDTGHDGGVEHLPSADRSSGVRGTAKARYPLPRYPEVRGGDDRLLDELAVPFEEGEHSDRLVLVGESQLGRMILVVFIERVASGIIRIIRARRATKRERRAYAEGD